ncbi:MAG TPA: response regulator [Flavitalea sp.]|nr:response regulator [Flavitalea sp.]
MFEKKVQKYFLYAEDDLDDAHIMLEFVQKIDANLEVVVRGNGSEIIEYLMNLESHQVLPCFILLDINLPQMDGLTALEILKSDDQFNTICVIMYSTSNSVADLEKAKSLGAAGFYTKPFSFDAVEKLVEEFVDLCHELPVARKN